MIARTGGSTLWWHAMVAYNGSMQLMVVRNKRMLWWHAMVERFDTIDLGLSGRTSQM